MGRGEKADHSSLYMLREKAAASIVGSALTLYNDDNDSYAYRSGSSEKLAAAHNLRMQRSTSSLDRKHQLQSQYHHHVQAAQRQQTTPAAKTSRRRSIRLRSHSLKLPRSMTLPQALPGQDAQLAPNSSNSSTHRCHRCRMAMAADAQAADTWAADMDRTRTLYAPRPRRPVVLASSLELFAPAGLSLPSSASSASQD